jgi:hypothetical protein
MSDDDEGIIVEELADLYDIEQAVAATSRLLKNWTNGSTTGAPPPIPKSLTEIGVYAKWV